MPPENQSKQLKRKVLVSIVSGTMSMLMLLLFLFLLPVRPGFGGNSNEHGGGGLGTASTGGGRASEGEAGQGTIEVTEVVEREGGADEASSSTHEQSSGDPESQQSTTRQEAGDSTGERPKSDLADFTIASLPEPVEITSQAASSSPGFDDVDDRLRDAGAKSGDIQISLAWNNINDIDLHVITPKGERIYYQNKRSTDGGELDVDMNAGGQRSTRPVENIFWQTNSAPAGRYLVQVHHYANHGARDPTHFQVIVKANGRSRRFEGTVSAGDRILNIHEFQLR